MFLKSGLQSINFVVVLLMLSVSPNVLAQQEKLLEQAGKEYENLGFIDANRIYLQVAESGYKSQELFQRLANTYYFNSNYNEALKWYSELFDYAKPEEISDKYYLRFAQTLRSTGQFEDAKKMYDAYIKKSGVSNKWLENANEYLEIIRDDKGKYQQKVVDINSSGIDFGGIQYSNRLVFSSTGDPNSKTSFKNTWNNMPLFDLYESVMENDGSYNSSYKIKGKVNTRKFNECCATFTKDGKTMYFTRNNTSSKNKRKKNEEAKLKIYRAHLIRGKWTKIEDLSINNNDYSTAHPALNHSEDKLYFSSDMPGSLGETDLYVVDIFNDGSLGTPKNLGHVINTKGRESFPFVTGKNELYFSSDGHFGLGGYDVFYTQLNSPGVNDRLVNLGEPINSNLDDFAFNLIGENIYVSSNRTGGLGYDDIYQFSKLQPIDYLTVKLNGALVEEETNNPIVDAEITVYDEAMNALAKVRSDAKGLFEVFVDPSQNYILKAQKENYVGDDTFITKGSVLKDYKFKLTRSVIKINDVKNGSSQTDISKFLNIVIYHNNNSSEIQPNAFVELEKLVAVLTQYPDLNVDILSYTSSLGSNAYNIWLSERRAQKVLKYLVERGISENRLSAKGLGEAHLTNKCADGVRCTDSEHGKNRRTEFNIKFGS